MDDCDVLLVGDSHFYYMTGEAVCMLDKPDIIDKSKHNHGQVTQHTKYKNIYYFHVSGATASGFRPEHISKTGAFDICDYYIKKLKNTVKLVFNFGHVDMRVLHLSKCIRENKKIDLNTFIDDVITKYISGILKINEFNKNIYIFGINPPSTRTVRILLSNTSNQDKFNDYKSLPYDFLLESRTENFRLFNEKLKATCEKYNFTYLDCWDRLVDDHQSVTRVLKFNYFHPDFDDHHIYIKNDPSWYDYFWNKIHQTLQVTPKTYEDVTPEAPVAP